MLFQPQRFALVGFPDGLANQERDAEIAEQGIEIIMNQIGLSNRFAYG